MTYFGMIVGYYTFVLLCLILPLSVPAGLYVMLVAASLFGEAYREGAAVVERGRGAGDFQAGA